ncbi:hypothetical protein EVAR_80431_1 [Eumeta japonica]|uniref:Uncharacterized protein n=1 Tax=Eumeta variegata TaxID=151549 RepID=A0A4C1VIN4_EUMVA|nr:hypothetical protein EVAR_80431_1 [Eumeta japonica]
MSDILVNVPRRARGAGGGAFPHPRARSYLVFTRTEGWGGMKNKTIFTSTPQTAARDVAVGGKLVSSGITRSQRRDGRARSAGAGAFQPQAPFRRRRRPRHLSRVTAVSEMFAMDNI